ncbi:MAG: DUF4411 family protein [Selenomonadaceae bacterium]|nr:DUF4411 family protein [Selenomonadaceae bacterium]
MVNYNLDSSVVIDILRGYNGMEQRMIDEVNAGNVISICSIVYYEVARGFERSGNNRKLEKFYKLYKDANHLYFDANNLDAVYKAIEIYENLPRGVTIEDADIFIAAAAIVNKCTLVTSNVRHFSRVAGLNFVNWRLP